MSLDPWTFLVILVMAAATAATRLVGPTIARNLTLTGRTKAAVEAIPGAVLVAVITPIIINSGAAGLLAAGVTAIAAWRGPVVLAVLTGIVSAALFRALLDA